MCSFFFQVFLKEAPEVKKLIDISLVDSDSSIVLHTFRLGEINRKSSSCYTLPVPGPMLKVFVFQIYQKFYKAPDRSCGKGKHIFLFLRTLELINTIV
jgi:hypothetical protein